MLYTFQYYCNRNSFAILCGLHKWGLCFHLKEVIRDSGFFFLSTPVILSTVLLEFQSSCPGSRKTQSKGKKDILPPKSVLKFPQQPHSATSATHNCKRVQQIQGFSWALERRDSGMDKYALHIYTLKIELERLILWKLAFSQTSKAHQKLQ